MDISKRFETLRFLKSPIKTVLLEALEYVKHFIIKKKLILKEREERQCVFEVERKEVQSIRVFIH